MKRLILLAIAFAGLAFGQGAPILQSEVQFVNGNGVPLAGAYLCSFAAGTTTPQATWSNASLTTGNPNPIVLDSNGRAQIYVNPAFSYKYTLYVGGTNACPSTGIPQWTQDNLTYPASGGGGGNATSILGVTIPVLTTGCLYYNSGTSSFAWTTCGGGSGVTSFSGDGILLNNSGSTGLVTAALANANAYKVFGNCTGSTGAPGYCSIVSAMLPATIAANTTGSAATLSGSLTQCTGSQFAQGITSTGAANCATPAGSGNVSNSGTPTAHQTAIWVTSTSIEGIGPGAANLALVSTGPSSDPQYQLINMTNGITGINPVPNGGTGVSTFTAHGPLLGELTNPIVSAAAGSAGAPFLSGGSSADGSYGAMNLAGGSSVVSGILPVGNGGTGVAAAQGTGTKVQLANGAATLNDCLKYDASGNAVDSGSPCPGGGSTYTAPGTGGTSQTQTNYNTQTSVSVLNYNAACDGVTDDHTALQNALNALGTNGITTLLIPGAGLPNPFSGTTTGVCLSSTRLILGNGYFTPNAGGGTDGSGGVTVSTVNGVTIRGAGGRILNGAGTGQSIIRYTGSHTSGNAFFIVSGPIRDVQIQGVAFDGNYLAEHVVVLNTVIETTIDDSSAENCTGGSSSADNSGSTFCTNWDVTSYPTNAANGQGYHLVFRNSGSYLQGGSGQNYVSLFRLGYPGYFDATVTGHSGANTYVNYANNGSGYSTSNAYSPTATWYQTPNCNNAGGSAYCLDQVYTSFENSSMWAATGGTNSYIYGVNLFYADGTAASGGEIGGVLGVTGSYGIVYNYGGKSGLYSYAQGSGFPTMNSVNTEFSSQYATGKQFLQTTAQYCNGGGTEGAWCGMQAFAAATAYANPVNYTSIFNFLDSNGEPLPAYGGSWWGMAVDGHAFGWGPSNVPLMFAAGFVGTTVLSGQYTACCNPSGTAYGYYTVPANQLNTWGAQMVMEGEGTISTSATPGTWQFGLWTDSFSPATNGCLAQNTQSFPAISAVQVVWRIRFSNTQKGGGNIYASGTITFSAGGPSSSPTTTPIACVLSNSYFPLASNTAVQWGFSVTGYSGTQSFNQNVNNYEVTYPGVVQ